MLFYVIFSDAHEEEFCRIADSILEKYKKDLEALSDQEEYILPDLTNPTDESQEEGEIDSEPEDLRMVKKEVKEEGPAEASLYEDISSDSESEPDGTTYQLVRICGSCQEPMDMAELPVKTKVKKLLF